jgi:hypothetical protein
MQDAGVRFFRGAADGEAIDNLSWGSRQGIRVYESPNVLVYRNSLFRNENSGVYFAAGSAHGSAIANLAWENVKGVRWSSQSSFGLALDNVLFDNRERGLALEDADGAVLRRNVLVDNALSQLFVLRSRFSADDDCYASGGAEQLVADFAPAEPKARFATLAAYQQAKRQDLRARGDGCGPLPPKLDVGRIHADSTAYAERARKLLAGSAAVPAPTPPERNGSWLGWFHGD